MENRVKSQLRKLGVCLANLRANPRGGSENKFDPDEADHPIRTARSVLFQVHAVLLPGVLAPVAVWDQEQRLALEILMVGTMDMEVE